LRPATDATQQENDAESKHVSQTSSRLLRSPLDPFSLALTPPFDLFERNFHLGGKRPRRLSEAGLLFRSQLLSPVTLSDTENKAMARDSRKGGTFFYSAHFRPRFRTSHYGPNTNVAPGPLFPGLARAPTAIVFPLIAVENPNAPTDPSAGVSLALKCEVVFQPFFGLLKT
jgi:hypothetical protein